MTGESHEVLRLSHDSFRFQDEGTLLILAGQGHASSFGSVFSLEDLPGSEDASKVEDINRSPEHVTLRICFGTKGYEMIEVSHDAMELLFFPSRYRLLDAFIAVLWKGVQLGVAYILNPIALHSGDPERHVTPVLYTGKNEKAAHPQRIGRLEYRLIRVRPCRYVTDQITKHWLDARSTMDHSAGDSWVLPRTTVLHRGFGQVSSKVNASGRGGRKRARENSSRSVTSAVENCIDFIEVDVQLTRDRTPVIFHDFEVNMQCVDRTTRRDELVSVPLGLVTMRQLNTVRILENKVSALKSLILKHWSWFRCSSSKTKKSDTASWEGNFVSYDIHTPTVNHDVLTLLQLLDSTPEAIGINLEIKYPKELGEEDRWRNLVVYQNMELYVDCVLKSTLGTRLRARRIVFSSFDPDICVLLRLKQNLFPVLFLTGGDGTESYNDPRCLGLDAALAFVKAAGLRGVVCNTDSLRADPSQVIQMFQKDKKWLWTWGAENNNPTWTKLLYSKGIDAVISDVPNLDDMHRF